MGQITTFNFFTGQVVRSAACVVIAGLFLSGCGGSNEEPAPTPHAEQDQPATGMGVIEHDVSPQDAAKYGLSVRQYRDVLDRLDRAAARGVTELPETQVVRAVPELEMARAQGECLQDAGWEVDIADDGLGVSYSLPADAAGQADFTSDELTCAIQYPIEDGDLGPRSDDYWRELYQYWVNERVPCIEAQGYDVDRAAIPSEETFVASESAAWEPTESLDSEMSMEMWEALQKQCPVVSLD